jgi:hypothetical protein
MRNTWTSRGRCRADDRWIEAQIRVI